MKNRGFTLLETIIVLAIMTMFFAVSIPFFSKFTEGAKLDTAARSVTSALRTARTLAITKNVPYYVFFVTINNEPSYYVSSADEAAPANPVNVVDKIYKLPTGIVFETIGFNSNRAWFKATGELGEAQVSNTVIKDNSGRKKTINVETTTGRARID